MNIKRLISWCGTSVFVFMVSWLVAITNINAMGLLREHRGDSGVEVIRHDAPTDEYGCHPGPDGEIHCH